MFYILQLVALYIPMQPLRDKFTCSTGTCPKLFCRSLSLKLFRLRPKAGAELAGAWLRWKLPGLHRAERHCGPSSRESRQQLRTTNLQMCRRFLKCCSFTGSVRGVRVSCFALESQSVLVRPSSFCSLSATARQFNRLRNLNYVFVQTDYS